MEKLNIERYKISTKLSKIEINDAFEFCLKKIDESLDEFTYKYPTPASENLKYQAIDNIEWTNGFWTGMLWLAYEVTRSDKYKKVAEIQVDNFLSRIENRVNVDHHDMGFLYSLSCVSAYKLTGNEKAKKAALLAADNLASRYREKGSFIQAWGQLDVSNNYRLIIDCLLNLPLLYWASKVSGDEHYSQIAENHFNTAVNLVIREDCSTHHTYFFDLETGKPTYGRTAQGFSDNSSWARGQAWGIYGLALSYGVLKNPNIHEKCINITNYFLNRLPSDYVPCWDLIFTDNETQKDSSSAPIAVCGMLEMMKYTNENVGIYKNAIYKIMRSLIDNYTTVGLNSNGILVHGVYNIPGKIGVDECNIWGDYFYMESLVRLMKDWDIYWY